MERDALISRFREGYAAVERAVDGLTDDDLAYSVDDWLRIYAGHSHDHATQIREAVRSTA